MLFLPEQDDSLAVQPPTNALASFPGPAHSSLTVRNSLRGSLREFHTASDEHAGPGNEATNAQHNRVVIFL